jgi:hypothetical protein
MLSSSCHTPRLEHLPSFSNVCNSPYKINAPSIADAVSEEMKAHLNNFHHTLNHGLGVVKNCIKEGNDTTTTNFHTFKVAIDALVTKDDMHEISSAIPTIMEKRIGATLSSSTKKRKTHHL